MITNKQIKNFIPCLTHNKNTIITPVNYLLNSLQFLKKHINFQLSSLQTIIGVDYLNSKIRFGIIYQLYSYTNKQHINIKIFFPLKKKIPSIITIFINSNWFEREIWDMFGIFFKQHPDLRRILTDYTFEGHPLRKDFPLVGFFETNFLEQKGGLVFQKLTLAQKLKF